MNRFACFLRSAGARALRTTALALVLVLAALTVTAPGLALAHARLVSSTPADGASVGAGLTEIVLTFSEEISPDQSSASLLGADGVAVQGVSASVDRANRTVMRILTPPLQAGKYTVKWEAVTEDDNGHTNGTLTFTVTGSGQAPTTTGGTATTPQSSLPSTGGPAGGLYLLYLPAALAVAGLAALTLGAALRLRASS
jgi:methionine-rich copper-binding protein CopC